VKNVKIKKYQSRKGYKWVIAGLCFLMIFVGLGFCSTNKSIYLYPITEALGIKRSAFSITDSIRFVVSTLLTLFFGPLVKKFGIKKLVVFGFISLIVSILIHAAAESLIWFYIAGVFLGIAYAWTSVTIVGTVINRWFSEKSGAVMGTIFAANGAGSVVSTQILSPFIYQEGNPFGYRQAYLVTALILTVVLALVLVLYKEKTDKDEKAEDKEVPSKPVWEGMDISRAKENPYFYCTAVCVFLFGMTLEGLVGIAAAHLHDVGIDSDFVVRVITVYSIFLAVSKFGAGFICDKFGLRVTASICNIAAIMALMALMLTNNSAVGMALALGYGVFVAMALPLDSLMIPIFAKELFGTRSYEQILGVFVAANNAGFAVGVPLMNLVFDIFGSYKPILLITAIGIAAVFILLQIIITQSNKWKSEKILEMV